MDTDKPSANKITALLEQKPFEVGLWNDLAQCIQAQNDLLSFHSIAVILAGLRELNEKVKNDPQAAFKPSSFASSIFIRLATSYNNPKLLKEAGMLFLQEWQLPGIALRLFERSQRLGGGENELRPLTEAASLAMQKQITEKDKSLPIHTGITTVQHTRPLAQEIIRKTGALMLSPGLRKPVASRHPIAAVVDEAEILFPTTTEKCLEEALAAAKERKFKRAEALLLKANENPLGEWAMCQAWSDLGKACYESGFYPEMKSAFLHAFKFNRSSVASHFNLALSQHLNENYDLAELGYRAADRVSPGNAKVWCNLGVLYFQIHDYAKSEDALRTCLKIDPEYARAWDNLASALGAQNKLEEALSACQTAVRLRPDFPEAYFKMGVIYFGNNLLSEAVASFEQAAAPHLAPFALAFLATLHARLEQMDAAESFVRQAIKADPACEILWMAWNEMGKAYFTLGNFTAAATSYEEATMIKIDEAESWFNLGLTYQMLGAPEKARSFYQQAVDLNERFYGAWHNLGVLYAEEGRHREASHAFRNELRIRPKDGRVWYDLAVSLEREGLPQEAAKAHEQARAFTEKVSS